MAACDWRGLLVGTTDGFHAACACGWVSDRFATGALASEASDEHRVRRAARTAEGGLRF